MSSSPRRPLYRRPLFLVILGVVVFVGAAVLVDLPVKVSRSDRQSQAAAYVNALKSDSSTCVAGLKESFGVEHLVLSGQATSSEHATIPKLLSDDWSACSLTDDNVYQMEANLTVPTFTGGSELVKVNRALYAWETVGAHETIGVLERLLGPPTNLSVQGQLTKAERVLTGERSRVEAARAKAAQAIGASLPVLGLPQPSPGTG